MKVSYRKKVYLIYCSELDRYKLGISDEPERRLMDIQSTSPTEVRLFAIWECPNASAIERFLHRHAETKRVIGEWFTFDNADVQFIDNAIRYIGGVRIE